MDGLLVDTEDARGTADAQIMAVLGGPTVNAANTSPPAPKCRSGAMVLACGQQVWDEREAVCRQLSGDRGTSSFAGSTHR